MMYDNYDIQYSQTQHNSTLSPHKKVITHSQIFIFSLLEIAWNFQQNAHNSSHCILITLLDTLEI